MWYPDKMDWVTFLVHQEDRTAVLDAVAASGVLHPAPPDTVDAWTEPLNRDDQPRLVASVAKQKDRVISLLQALSVQDFSVKSPPRFSTPDSFSETGMNATLDAIEAQVMPLLSVRETLRQQRDAQVALLTRSEPFQVAGVPLSDLAHTTWLFSITGILESAQRPRLEQLLEGTPSLILSFPNDRNTQRILCVVLRGDQAKLEAMLKEVSLRDTATGEALWGALDGSSTAFQDSVVLLDQQLTALETQIQAARTEMAHSLVDIWYRINAVLLMLRLRAHGRTTNDAFLFSGWVPHTETAALIDRLQQTTNGRILSEQIPAEELDKVLQNEIPVPVRLSHPGFFKPFGMLLENYGLPAYRTIDPTCLMAMAFLLMFGMMFGDIGHGLVLVAGGLLLRYYEKPGGRDIGRLILYCGVSSSLFGMLFGSIFGVEEVFPALWTHPLTSSESLFSVAILFGMILISTGVILNILNAYHTHTLLQHSFKAFGVLGGMAYWTGIALVVALFTIPQMKPVIHGLVWALLVLFLLFFARDPVLWAMGKKAHVFSEGIVAYGFECLVEIAETIMNYLANTVSFIRVAAFGMAHAGLLVAIFELNDLIATLPGGTVLSILLLVLGNLFVIVFEGAVATIQVIRLEYYEFFSKFFNDFGEKYDPVQYPNPLMKENPS